MTDALYRATLDEMYMGRKALDAMGEDFDLAPRDIAALSVVVQCVQSSRHGELAALRLGYFDYIFPVLFAQVRNADDWYRWFLPLWNESGLGLYCEDLQPFFWKVVRSRGDPDLERAYLAELGESLISNGQVSREGVESALLALTKAFEEDANPEPPATP